MSNPSAAGFNLQEFFQKFGTFQDLSGIDTTTLESLYAVAHQLYSVNKYQEAEKAFQLLCFYNHLERKYWLGLGATRQMQKKHSEALDAFTYAILLGFEEPSAHMYAADCYLALGKKEGAISALRTVIELVGQKPQHKATKEKAKGLLELLEAPNLSQATKPKSPPKTKH
jgi:type III secretion system low calcium response chaperone LcrH/SycD